MDSCCSLILFTDSVSKSGRLCFLLSLTSILLFLFLLPFPWHWAPSLQTSPMSWPAKCSAYINPSHATRFDLPCHSSHSPASQASFIYAPPPTICPCIPPLRSDKSKYCLYCASSWLSAALQISSMLSYAFLKSSAVSEIRKHLIIQNEK